MNRQIEFFLMRRPSVRIEIEKPEVGIRKLWHRIGAEGDIDAVLDGMKERRNQYRTLDPQKPRVTAMNGASHAMQPEPGA
jgi:hypothetical protein